MSTEPMGSLAEEAAKLMAVVQTWAQDRGAPVDEDDAQPGPAHDPVSPACRYCPVCAAVRLAGAATPEVRGHLASATMSLALAVKALLDSDPVRPHPSAPVEKIDLAED